MFQRCLSYRVKFPFFLWLLHETLYAQVKCNLLKVTLTHSWGLRPEKDYIDYICRLNQCHAGWKNSALLF